MLWICCYSHLSQTATKDATIHSTAIDIDRCSLVCCCIDITESRTAIDIAFYEAGTRVGDAGSLAGLSADVHHNVTANYCCLTTSTTIDVVADGTIHHVYFGVTIYVGSITTAIDVGNGVAATFILNGYLGVTLDGLVRISWVGRDGRHVTSTIYGTFYQAVVLDGQIRSAHLTEVMQIHIGANVIRFFTCQMTA